MLNQNRSFRHFSIITNQNDIQLDYSQKIMATASNDATIKIF